MLSVTIFNGISLSHWHFEGKGPKFSRSALHVRGSYFKILVVCFPGTLKSFFFQFSIIKLEDPERGSKLKIVQRIAYSQIYAVEMKQFLS